MSDRKAMTVLNRYYGLILFLTIIVHCGGRSFDWGNIKQRYDGIGDDDGEELLTQDVRMPGVHPTEDDVYMCTSVQMPRQDAYIVNFEPHASMKTAHHMLLYGCSDISSSPGQAYKCDSMGICKGGSSAILFAWARNAQPPNIPEGVGFHVGGRNGHHYVTLQIHYGHKDAFKVGEEDTSGIKLSMTYTPQPYLAGIYLMVSGDISVPPHSHNVHVDLACEYTDSTPIYPFAFRTHAHELGTVISGYLIKEDQRGSWLEIAKGNPNWPQAFYPMQPGIEVKQGDWLTARCTYSSDREISTKVGPTGADEMCNLYLMYYTDARYGKSYGVCSLPARGDIKTHFPHNSDIPPDKMPTPRQLDYSPYNNQDYSAYNYGEYRERIPDIFNTDDHDFGLENKAAWNTNDGLHNSKPADDNDGDLPPAKSETEKPSKTEGVSTQATSFDKGVDKVEGAPGEDKNSKDFEEAIGSGKLTLADWQTDDNVTLGQVAGLAVDSQGNIHVFHRETRIWNVESFDAKNRFAQVDDGPIVNSTVIAYDPKTGKIVHQWGGKVDIGRDCVTCFHGFYLPHGLHIDHEGNVWLTDVALHQVFKFPAGGSELPIFTLGEKFKPGPDKDHFCKPADVAVDPSTGNIYVADGYCNNRIVKFSPQGDFLMQWGKMAYKSSGYPFDAFLIPHSITYLKDRDVVCVADREHGRIQCFNSGNGTFVDSYMPTSFGGRVFAVHYNPWNGGVLYAVNGPSAERIPVQGFTLGYKNRQLLQAWKPGKVEFQNPHDVECSADNTAVYVAEIGPNKVWKFDVDITVLAPADVCQSNPCFNQGSCVRVDRDSGVKYYCYCPSPYWGAKCQFINFVTPSAEENEIKENVVRTNQVSGKSTDTGNPVSKSYKGQGAGLKAQTDEDINGHTLSATDANTATTAIIVAVLAVPIVLMMMVAVAVRLRAQGKIKFGTNGVRKGYNSTSDRFSLGNFFNRRKGFNQVNTEDSDHDGGMEWSDESDIEEYSILNSKTAQNL